MFIRSKLQLQEYSGFVCVRCSQFSHDGILLFVHGDVHALFACADMHLYDLLGLSSSFDWPTLFYHKKDKEINSVRASVI